MPKPEDAVEEKSRPKDEESDHEPMNYIDHVINLTAVRGEVFWDTEELGWTHGKRMELN